MLLCVVLLYNLPSMSITNPSVFPIGIASQKKSFVSTLSYDLKSVTTTASDFRLMSACSLPHKLLDKPYRK